MEALGLQLQSSINLMIVHLVTPIFRPVGRGQYVTMGRAEISPFAIFGSSLQGLLEQTARPIDENLVNFLWVMSRTCCRT